MPAKHRMQVTPTERSFLLLKRLEALTGKAPATTTREILDDATDALEMMVEALESIRKRPKEVEAAIARMAAKAHQTIAQATLDLGTDKKPGPKPKDRGRGAAKPR